MIEFKDAPTKSKVCAWIRTDFSKYMLTPTKRRGVVALPKSMCRFLACPGEKKSVVKVGKEGEATASDMGCYCKEYLGKEPGGSSKVEREYSLLKVVRGHHESETMSVTEVDVHVKVCVLHIESCNPSVLF